MSGTRQFAAERLGIPWHLDPSIIPSARPDEFASLRGWTRDPSAPLRQAPPSPPTRAPCSRHGEDPVEIASWGQPRTFMCGHCGGDPDVPAAELHARALERYRVEAAEYNALTSRVEAIEAELRASVPLALEPWQRDVIERYFHTHGELDDLASSGLPRLQWVTTASRPSSGA